MKSGAACGSVPACSRENIARGTFAAMCGVRMKPVGAIGSMVLSIALLVNSMGGVGTLSNIKYYMNSLILL